MKQIFLSTILSISLFGNTYDLIDIYNLSFSNSESYKISESEKDSADKEVGKALSSFYPKVSIDNEYMKLNEFSVVVDSIEQEKRTHRRDITYNIDQLIYDRSEYLNYKIQKNAFLQSEINITKKHQELISDVIQYYLDALLKAKQVELVKQQQKRLEVIFQRAKTKYKNGFISKTDYFEAKLQLEEVLTQKINKELDYKVSKSFLQRYTGIDKIEIKKNIELNSLNIQHIDQLINEIGNNLDLQIQNLKVKSSEIEVSHSISEFEPTVSLNYEQINNNVPGVDTEKTVTLLIKLNIFNGFYDQKNYQQSKIQKRIATLELHKLMKDIKQNVQNKIYNVNALFTIIQDYPKILKSKEFILEGMQERFNIGTKSLIELLDEEEEYFKKLNTYTEYKYKFLIEYTELIEATNGLNTNFLQEINRLIYE